MSGFEDFYTSHKGIKHEWENAGDGTYNIRASQDLEGVLDFCKAAYNHNDGYSKSRELKRAFFLPDILYLKWLQEEGWDAYAPENRDRLKRKMNDPDYQHLKTAPGHI